LFSHVTQWQSWHDILDFDVSAICPDLAWNTSPFCAPNSHQHVDESTLLYYDLDDAYDSVLEPSVDFVSDTPSTCPMDVDPASKYLYALDLHLFATNLERTQYYVNASHQTDHLLQAHMDAGSMTSTTNRLDYLWDYKLIDGTSTTLRVADDTPHHPVGVGFVKVPISGIPNSLLVRTFYTPTLPATILSPASIASDTGYSGYTSFANLNGQECSLTLHDCYQKSPITFPLQFRHGLLFTHALTPPKLPSNPCSHDCDCPRPRMTSDHLVTPSMIHQLTKTQLSHLWHQRLGHINRRSVAEMHCHAKGIPQLPVPSELDNCPVCLSTKLHRVSHGKTDTRHAHQCYQGISIDFGFFVQRSSNSARFSQLQGLNGETCYCLIVCHFSGMLFSETF